MRYMPRPSVVLETPMPTAGLAHRLCRSVERCDVESLHVHRMFHILDAMGSFRRVYTPFDVRTTYVGRGPIGCLCGGSTTATGRRETKRCPPWVPTCDNNSHNRTHERASA